MALVIHKKINPHKNSILLSQAQETAHCLLYYYLKSTPSANAHGLFTNCKIAVNNVQFLV